MRHRPASDDPNTTAAGKLSQHHRMLIRPDISEIRSVPVAHRDSLAKYAAA